MIRTVVIKPKVVEAQRLPPQQGMLHYRPACPVRVYASANDELPDPKAPRYA